MTPEAVISLVFGIIMFVLAGVTLWHMHIYREAQKIEVLPSFIVLMEYPQALHMLDSSKSASHTRNDGLPRR